MCGGGAGRQGRAGATEPDMTEEMERGPRSQKDKQKGPAGVGREGSQSWRDQQGRSLENAGERGTERKRPAGVLPRHPGLATDKR